MPLFEGPTFVIPRANFRSRPGFWNTFTALPPNPDVHDPEDPDNTPDQPDSTIPGVPDVPGDEPNSSGIPGVPQNPDMPPNDNSPTEPAPLSGEIDFVLNFNPSSAASRPGLLNQLTSFDPPNGKPLDPVDPGDLPDSSGLPGVPQNPDMPDSSIPGVPDVPGGSNPSSPTEPAPFTDDGFAQVMLGVLPSAGEFANDLLDWSAMGAIGDSLLLPNQELGIDFL